VGPERPRDGVVAVGITMLTLGALAAVIGGSLAAINTGEELCSVGGCVTRADHVREQVAGGVLGGGVGLLASGTASVVDGRMAEGRRSRAMTDWGAVLTNLGAALAGAGAGALIADASRGDVDQSAVSVPLLLAGVAFAATGVPLWVVGGADDGADRAARAP
jgi:hypothetical protein